MYIYDVKGHGIYEKDRNFSQYASLEIITLEVLFDCGTGELLGVQGFFPLTKAMNATIEIPECEEDAFRFDPKIRQESIPFVAHSYGDYFKGWEAVFNDSNLLFDRESRLIRYGLDCAGRHIRINENLYVAVDSNGALSCLFIKIDSFEE